MRTIATILLILSSTVCLTQQPYKRTLKLMGSRFDITVVAIDSDRATIYLDTAVKEISRIERLISSWDADSQTSEINRNAGLHPVKVSEELFELIERAIKISKLTDGAFDISYASMDKIWKFDGSMKTMPDIETIKKSVSKVGYKNIVLDKTKSTVFLQLSGMKLGFGAVGKGYAADRTKALWYKQTFLEKGKMHCQKNKRLPI